LHYYEGKSAPLLSPYRVLDLTDEKGLLCAKVLGDLGADVIKIERPGGDPSRNLGPFYHDIPHPENSLYWFAYNTSKRGITLNIEDADGQDILLRLVKTVDFVIESFPPGYMESLGLGYSALSEINPRLVMTSITPFGQSGPWRDYKAPDIVAMALSGLVLGTGDPDRAPVRIGVPQAYLQAGAQAAMGSMIAHYHRQLTGEGQHVDVSIHESALWAAAPAQAMFELDPGLWEFHKTIPSRGSKTLRGTVVVRSMWPCKDGYLCWRMMTGPGLGQRVSLLVEWMNEEGMAGDMMDVNWEEIDLLKLTQEQIDRWEELWINFFKVHTMAELYEEAVKRGILIYPVATVEEVMENRQLAARDFFVILEHPELGVSITYPGVPFKSSEVACRLQRRAPLIGEHNDDIYVKELGLSPAELVALKERNVI
jgi:crotonobetainyl-CoA:carnitine CoA-transferase CaiB-like acyl-CoA transferase